MRTQPVSPGYADQTRTFYVKVFESCRITYIQIYRQMSAKTLPRRFADGKNWHWKLGGKLVVSAAEAIVLMRYRLQIAQSVVADIRVTPYVDWVCFCCSFQRPLYPSFPSAFSPGSVLWELQRLTLIPRLLQPSGGLKSSRSIPRFLLSLSHSPEHFVI